MIKKIHSHTDAAGLKMLRTPCAPVLSVTDDIKELINDLAETCMADENCVGLSANQIWTDLIVPPPAVFVIRMADGAYPFINPKLIKEFKKSEVMEEGCMSVPSLHQAIERPKHVLVSFTTADAMEMKDQHLFHLLARIWLHEYDHLQGKLIIDYGRS